MAYSKTYDRSLDAGSSGGEVNDLNPQRAYDVDIRRLDEKDQRIAGRADTRNELKQNRVGKFLRAKRSAGSFLRSENTMVHGRIGKDKSPPSPKEISLAGPVQQRMQQSRSHQPVGFITKP